MHSRIKIWGGRQSNRKYLFIMRISPCIKEKFSLIVDILQFMEEIYYNPLIRFLILCQFIIGQRLVSQENNKCLQILFRKFHWYFRSTTKKDFLIAVWTVSLLKLITIWKSFLSMMVQRIGLMNFVRNMPIQITESSMSPRFPIYITRIQESIASN